MVFPKTSFQIMQNFVDIFYKSQLSYSSIGAFQMDAISSGSLRQHAMIQNDKSNSEVVHLSIAYV